MFSKIIDVEIPTPILPGRQMGDEASVHEAARGGVGDPDLAVDVLLPHLGDLGMSDVEAVLLDRVQGDELDIRVVVAERAANGDGEEWDESPMVLAVDQELFVVCVRVDPIYQHRERLVHVFVLEGQAEVVPDELPEPECGGLVDELGGLDDAIALRQSHCPGR